MTRARDSKAKGSAWESRAADFLVARGVEILTRSWRCRLGEIDIIGRDGGTLVIVEVRARSRTTRARASESVSPLKQRRIVNATRHFLMCHPELASRPVRFDVVAVDAIDTPAPTLRWIRHAFDAA